MIFTLRSSFPHWRARIQLTARLTNSVRGPLNRHAHLHVSRLLNRRDLPNEDANKLTLDDSWYEGLDQPTLSSDNVPPQLPTIHQDSESTQGEPLQYGTSRPWFLFAMDRLLEKGNSAGIFQKCQEMTDQGIGPDKETYAYFFKACKLTGQFQRAYRGLEEMLQRGIPANLSHFHLVMSIAMLRRHSYGCQKVYDLMQNYRVQPSTLTYQYLIGSLCLEGQVELAYRLWGIIRSSEFEPTETTTELLVNALATVRAVRESFGVLLECEERNLSVKASTYMHLFRTATEVGHIDATLHTWKKAVDVFRMQPTHGDCLLAIRVAASRSRPDLAADVIRVMNLFDYQCTEPYLDALFTSFIKVQDWRSGLNVLVLLREAGYRVERPMLHPLERQLFRFPAQTAIVLDVIKELQLEGKMPFLSVLNTLLSVTVRQGNIRDAIPFLRQFKPVYRVEPDRDTYHILLEGCIATGDKVLADQLFQEMKESSSVQPTPATYSKMILLNARRPDYEKAFDLLEEMKSLDMIPPATVYGTLIKKCVLANDSRAKMALREMELFGYTPYPELRMMVESKLPV
ncbi:hypothetical protein IWQ61_008705 [Dispira simplex]|nr:hypothetical protein IWQ61_008705 [Dispira simplex]